MTVESGRALYLGAPHIFTLQINQVSLEEIGAVSQAANSKNRKRLRDTYVTERSFIYKTFIIRDKVCA